MSRWNQYFETHMEELLADVERLVRIDSGRADALPQLPFGKGAADCLKEAEAMLKSYGFRVRNHENYVLTADIGPDEPGLDILAHLDVVPAGSGWTVTKPFCMKRQDGRIYGRGTADDKGPALCAAYAMRAVLEAGVPLNKRVRLILGSDEECGGEDLDYYFKKEKSAPMSFSPDADFPVINIEKGRLHSGFTAKVKNAKTAGDTSEIDSAASGLGTEAAYDHEKEADIVSFHGGVKINVVPDEASAVVCGLPLSEAEAVIAGMPKKTADGYMYPEYEAKIIAAASAYTDKGTSEAVNIQASVNDETNTAEPCVCITAKGVTAHASTPEDGVNAVTGLLALLVRLPLPETETVRAFRSINGLFPHGDFYGEAAGVALADEKSGRTTMTLNILKLENGGLEGLFDLRASIAATDANTRGVLYKRFERAGLTPMNDAMCPPHIVDEKSEFVQTLLSCYCSVTGEEAKPIAIGGGTYVHGIENGVAFGCAKLGVDNRMHGADEYMEISQMMLSCEVFAEAIVRLCADSETPNHTVA